MSVATLSSIENMQKSFTVAVESNDVNSAIDAINKQVERMSSAKSFIINNAIQLCMLNQRADFVKRILETYPSVNAVEVINSILDSYKEMQIPCIIEGEGEKTITIAKLSNDIDSAIMMNLPPLVNHHLSIIRSILQKKIERQISRRKYHFKQAEATTDRINVLKAQILYKSQIKPALNGFITKQLPGCALARVKDLFIFRRLKALCVGGRKALQLKDIQHVFEMAQAMSRSDVVHTVPEIAL